MCVTENVEVDAVGVVHGRCTAVRGGEVGTLVDSIGIAAPTARKFLVVLSASSSADMSGGARAKTAGEELSRIEAKTASSVLQCGVDESI